jgi:hypothetical protein
MLCRRAPGAATLALALVAACLLAGCGSPQSEASLPSGLAARLATASDKVAADLGRNDACAAATDAAGLRTAASEAIRVGQVPPTLAPELTRRVRALAAAIRCTSPAAPSTDQQPPPAPKEHDRGKHKGDKNDGDGEGGDHG